jgi:RNA polymerase sigma-70 factor (ECF subfamily)
MEISELTALRSNVRASEETRNAWNMADVSVSKVTKEEQEAAADESAAEGERDSELIERHLAGSDEAFNRLVLKHQRSAINLAYRFLGNYEDACDVAQEAFVRVYKNLSRFKGDCSFKTWMYKIVLNLSRNKYRWKKRRGEFGKVSIDNPGGENPRKSMEIPDTSLSVGKEITRKEIRQRIMESLNHLPRNHREILVLRHMEGFSYSDIARTLGCSEGTIKSRVHRARVEIRKLLADMIES